jgi:hypothetical protein
MNISTFMSLVWVLFGSNCNYYKSLCQIFKTLELKEVYALKASFTPENCRRITWAILDDGRACFDDVKTRIHFTSPEMSFPQLYLIDILNKVRYAVPIQRASFPEEWQRRDQQMENKGQGRSPGGQGPREPCTGNYPHKGGYGDNAGGPARNNNYGQWGFGGPPAQGMGDNPYGGQRDWRAGWNDVRHPKIKTMMGPYLERYNSRIHLAEVLNAAGKRQTNLPTMPKFCHVNGRPFLCWNSTLGRCMYCKCKFLWEGGHPGPNNITNNFAEKVCVVIGPGIQKRMQQGGGDGSPAKKVKTDQTNEN